MATSLPRLLVSGSRDYTNESAVEDALLAARFIVPELTTSGPAVLVHGAAAGLDLLAASVSQKPSYRQWVLDARPAQWDQHAPTCPPHHAGQATCKSAGHRRNAAMLTPRPAVLFAFPTHRRELPAGVDRKRTSRGTWSMVDKALAAGVPTIVVWTPVDPQGQPLGEPELWPCDATSAGWVAEGAKALLSVNLGDRGQVPVRDLALPF